MLTALMLHGALVVLFVGMFGRWLDEEVVADVCLLGLGFELLLAMISAQYLQVTDAVYYLQGGALLAQWGTPRVSLSLCFDELSAFFLSILAFALILCFFFLVEYFEYDAHAGTIIFLSALFSQAALLYFSVFDLCLLIFFWEVISFISFLLVQHWAFRLSSFKAGLKVFTVSQVGDLPLFLFTFLLLSRVGSSDLGEILGLLPTLAFEYLAFSVAGVTGLFHFVSVLGLLLQVAVLLKAAQWFFYPWLLDAMEAPVPISAQLHSSTLVVIGFYLFFRFQVLFDLAPLAKTIFCLAGLLTSVGASVLGFYQEDGKKLLACSTAGQLGYVLVALGLDLYGEALCLLTFCCCNKAMTFVWFGVLMRRFSGLSDFRYLSGQGLAWTEHAGLFAAIANFTILPGAFCWHVKGLFGLGSLPWRPQSWAGTLGLGLLQFTWFFSSLYLVGLYYTLFYGPRSRSWGQAYRTLQGPYAWSQRLSLLRRRPQQSVGALQPTSLLCLTWFALLGLVWYTGLFGLLLVDATWVEAVGGVAGALAYF